MPLALLAAAVPQPPLLLRHPTMNATEIVFSYAGDLWSVPRAGGEARRLTSGKGVESDPFFSPDGKTLAFTGEYDGNTDVFTMPAEGGTPKRLTAHPAPDQARGWTPDGKGVLFASQMLSNTDLPRLFTVPTGGGFPKALPLPSGTMASYSPDGARLAYVPGFKWQAAWKRYRGGQTYPVWIADLKDSKITKVPRENTNDEQPMWVGDRIYFLSDPTGPVGLSSYGVKDGKVRVEVPGAGFDLKSATAGPGGIVLERLGGLEIFDPATRKTNPVDVRVNADLPEVRSEFKDVSDLVSGATISPSGARVAITARGWLFTVPAKKGDARLVSEKQGVHRHHPAWSPDGKTIAFVSDENDGQQLALYDPATAKTRFVPLGGKVPYYSGLVWAPNGEKISYTDYAQQLWVLDVRTGVSVKLDEGLYSDPYINMRARWSPDSKWITWSRDLENHLGGVFLHSFETGKTTQITDGLANAKSPVFDRGGDYLYFYASTNTGLAASWLDLSSYAQPNVLSRVYAVVLKKNGPSPLAPESDEEAAGAKPPEAKPEPFRVDLEDIEHRIVALPMPPRAYGDLDAGPEGTFLAWATPARATATTPSFGGNLYLYDLDDRQERLFAPGVTGFELTPDGTKALLLRPGGIAIASTQQPSSPAEVGLDGLQVRINPRDEWRQMFEEVWRNEPILFYASNLHGINARAMAERYRPFLAGLGTRSDLNYLFDDMLGEISIGHMFPGGGDMPYPDFVPGGLLGADYAFENGRYRLTRVYDGERWNPGLYAPLAQPGVLAKAGEYVLAIDGKELTDATDIYEVLEGKAGRQVRVKIGPNPDGKDAREAVVVPVGSEFGLRTRAWAEDNRRYVEKATQGRAGYVHVPDTNDGGWDAFTRYYYAQIQRDGIVVDERFNHGGLINDFMVREMTKTPDGAFTPRYGKDWPTPGAAIYGPKVMIVNQFAGSGGDMFPWLFREHKIGKLVGKRTWGGLVAAFGFPLVDGGQVNSPDHAFYDFKRGKWDVEGHGVDPDIEVELDPYLWRQGRDAQLEAAVAEINARLATYTRPRFQRPPNPDKTKVGGRF